MLRPSSRFTGSSASAVPLSAASGRCGRRVRAADVAQTPGRSCVRSARPELRTGHRPRHTGSFRCRFHPLFVVSFCTESPISPPRLPVWPTAAYRDRGSVFFYSGQVGRFRPCSSPFSNLSFLTESPIFPTRLPVWPTADHRDRGPVFFHSGRVERFRPCSSPFFNLPFRAVSPSSLPYTTPEAAGGGHGRGTVLFCFRGAVSRFGPSDCISGNGAALGGIREGGRTGNPVPRLSPFSDILFSVRKNDDIQFKDRPSDRRHAYF